MSKGKFVKVSMEKKHMYTFKDQYFEHLILGKTASSWNDHKMILNRYKVKLLCIHSAKI